MLRRPPVRIFGLLAAVAGCWLLTQRPASGDDPPLPLRGTAEGVAAFSPPNTFAIEATGTATHLGRFAREEILFLNPDGSFSGTIVFTAADGDELHADVSGAFTSPGTAEGAYTFTGGTGRFRGATGAATFDARTPDGVRVAITFEGAIRY